MPHKPSEKIIKSVETNKNPLSLFISFTSISNPIIKSRKYIPILAKNLNVSEEVITGNGLYKLNIKPRNKAENIHGTLIFSIRRPPRKVIKYNKDKIK